MSGDGVLYSEASGYPIGCETDGECGLGQRLSNRMLSETLYKEETGMLKLVVQRPQPFDQSQLSHCLFEYDEKSATIAVRMRPLVHDICSSPQSQTRSNSAWGSVSSGSPVSISFDSNSEGSTLADEEPYMLEFKPRRHRHSSFSQVFDRLLEAPTDGPTQGLGAPPGHSPSQHKIQNDSWHESRDVKLVPERECSVTVTRMWKIVPVRRLSREGTSKAWSVIEDEFVHG